jgi:uncharacterized membrane protein YesL
MTHITAFQYQIDSFQQYFISMKMEYYISILILYVIYNELSIIDQYSSTFASILFNIATILSCLAVSGIFTPG